MGSSIASWAYVFNGCTNITTLTIGDGVITIPDYAFCGCSGLTTVTIPNSVTEIGSSAFGNCQNISIVKAEWISILPAVDGSAFNNVPLNNVTLSVPIGTTALYSSTTPWSLFGNIVEDSLMLITVSSCSDNMGVVTGSGSFLVGDTDTLTATANYGFHFVRWSDNNTENPRILVCVQDSTLVAIFEPNEYTLICNNGVGGGVYPYLSQVEIHALPQGNLQFRGWSDSIMDNPRTVTVLSDTTFSAVFTSPDTTYIHDTTTIYDSVYVDVFVHDTTYVPVHDTTYIDVHDTTYVPIHDTIYIDVHDTTYIDVPYAVHDTTLVVDTLTLTEYVPVHDTTYIDVHDTTYIDVPYPVHDTSYIDVPYPVHDTTIVVDTLTVTQYDTVTNTVYDTIANYVYDTVTLTDTLWLTQYDTLWLHDTIIIHDTVYITEEGIGDVETLNAKVYSSEGRIVVEGADGHRVTLYDVTGRVLATKQGDYSPLRFDAPASGTYLIKIGAYPARRVVVIR